MTPSLALVGLGHLGTYHLQKMQILAKEGTASIVGVIDTDAGRQQKAAAQDLPVADSLEALIQLTGKRPDGVVIAAPTIYHHQLGLEALEAGAHILVEKPIAASEEEAKALVATAERLGKILQVGHTERFNPAVAAALAVVDRPRYMVAERLGAFSGRSTDIDVVLDLMIHDLDIVAALIPSPLKEVRAIGIPLMTQAMDMASARLAFEDGSVAQLSASRASMEPSRKIRLFTPQRYVSIDCGGMEVKSVKRLPPGPDSQWAQISGEPIEVKRYDALEAQLRDFVGAISEGRKPRVDGEAGLSALRLALAVGEEISMPSLGDHELPADMR